MKKLKMDFSDRKVIKEILLFCKAFGNTKREMWISFQVLLIVALVLSWLMYFAESVENPKYSFLDALIWTFVKFVDDPADIVEAPATIFGQVVGTFIGVVGVAIFAVPAGLIGSGFVEAMEENRRKKEIDGYRRKMERTFTVGAGRQLKQYLEKLPKDKDAWYNGCKFGYVNNNINVAKFQLKGMSLKDILDVCNEYPCFRVKNEASAMSIEEGREDRYMLEHFPVNRRYGYFINRGSKVTIVSTSSESELCIGNFSYYLAKFAGFNYISKDFNAADGESLYNNDWKEPLYEGVTLKARLENCEKVSKEIKEAYANKQSLRDEFISDLESLCKDEGSWVICLLSHLKHQEDKVDVHIAHSLADGTSSTILSDKSKFEEIKMALSSNLSEELGLVVEDTTRFPLIKKNIAYKLQNDGCRCNCFTLRVSYHLMEFDARMRVAQFIMSKTIHDAIEPGHHLLPEEIVDMNRGNRSFGFADQEMESVRNDLYSVE